MPKLDLDAAKKRCDRLQTEWFSPQHATPKRMDEATIIHVDLPAALAECKWSREMLGRMKESVEEYRDVCKNNGWTEDHEHNDILLRTLEKGPPDVA